MNGKHSNSEETNWYVITGGPSTGKTTTIDLLRKRGYHTTIEYARHYIDTLRDEGNSVEEIRRNKKKFQLAVLEMQIVQEAALKKEDVVFLDRAIPDAMAYCRFLKLGYDEKLLKAVQEVSYRKIFILDRVPFKKDYARTENAHDQLLIHHFIIETYTSLGFLIVFVPVLAPAERVQYLLDHL